MNGRHKGQDEWAGVVIGQEGWRGIENPTSGTPGQHRVGSDLLETCEKHVDFTSTCMRSTMAVRLRDVGVSMD